jgi:hypothetical protein
MIGVSALVPNRGGIRLRPLDDVEGVPIYGARIRDPVFEGGSSYVDIGNGVLGRAPIEPDTFTTEITAPGHDSITRPVTVSAGSWFDMGDVVMTRTGDMPDPNEVCASPAAIIGKTVEIDVTGVGFFPGDTLELTCSDGDVTIESFAYQNWSTISATVTVASGATQARSGCLRVTNPDGNFDFGDLLKMPPQPEIFADGFESGSTSGWSISVN